MERCSITALCIILCLSVLTISVDSTIFVPADSLHTGPYIDRLEYKVIANQDQRVLALQAGEIEMDFSYFDPVHLSRFDEDSSISVYQHLRNGYSHFTINCAKYPLNISGLRRAIAFAFDKGDVVEHYLEGFGILHDSVVPKCNGWCVEDDFDFHYYAPQPDIGNAILDDLNFAINPTTGYRCAPDGTPFNITLEYAAGCGGPYAKIPFIAALESLNISGVLRPADFNDYIERLDNHGDYDIVYYGFNFYSNRVDWLANEYRSENADVYRMNPTNFRNESFDAWIDQLLYSDTYEEVYEASSEMQKILHYNVPRIVVYENTYLQGYRNNKFTGHVPDLLKGIAGPWTMRHIRKIDGTLGDSVPVAMSQEPDSFNLFVTSSEYSKRILENLYSCLYHLGPDGKPVVDLAKNMDIETHSTNPAVIPGHTRYIIDIVQNATWTDGEPLTAEDVAFTFNYMIQMEPLPDPEAQPLDWGLSELYAVYAPTNFTVIFEFTTESYWNFEKFAFRHIIPKHIYTSEICSTMHWSEWNPVFNPEHPMVTSGPFSISDYDSGEFYELTRNPNYYYRYEPQIPTTPTPTTTTNGATTPEGLSPTIVSLGMMGAVVITMIVIVEVFSSRKVKS
jgi:ABC-type transport system substrate-binding protein